MTAPNSRGTSVRQTAPRNSEVHEFGNRHTPKAQKPQLQPTIKQKQTNRTEPAQAYLHTAIMQEHVHATFVKHAKQEKAKHRECVYARDVMYANVHSCMYVCMYVRTHVRTYVRTYVCTYMPNPCVSTFPQAKTHFCTTNRNYSTSTSKLLRRFAKEF